jgi:hypothetical protein
MMDYGKYYWKEVMEAVKDSGNPSARRNQMQDVYAGTARFQEWSGWQRGRLVVASCQHANLFNITGAFAASTTLKGTVRVWGFCKQPRG